MIYGTDESKRSPSRVSIPRAQNVECNELRRAEQKDQKMKTISFQKLNEVKGELGTYQKYNKEDMGLHKPLGDDM